ncbi:hypothetical protein [Curtobacterium caseinilyticum]|uniref:Uncharacterized protein n=1 Tax=Curtobacterium caseinilyticum TaxID=3055137 RepID=A0ABT7TTH4_9MICO|nr:hypothetical protein [Curtobacterium caseinilyticum]MDM7892898.1 hypothetical protein [Curtobacterium caseinilyticum]
MDTEPPQGDDLQRMLVPMKRHVLEHATPRRSRRGRTTGIALGIVGVLLLGATGGGVALGLIPTSFTGQAQAPAPSDTPEQLPSEAPSGAPVSDEPTPVLTPTSTPTPTPTSTRPPYSLSDPSTWTISGTEVGPVALGGQLDAETDDLRGVLSDEFSSCSNPRASFWAGKGTLLTIITGADGRIESLSVRGLAETTDRPPTTAAGIGPGSTVAELRAAYPDLRRSSTSDPDPAVTDDPYGGLTTTVDGSFVTFSTRGPDFPVDEVWVSTVDDAPPTEYCN